VSRRPDWADWLFVILAVAVALAILSTARH
jgi:uncharacterized protein involved in cysteine biosynthesis